MNVGGVVVDPTDTLDSHNILKQAEQNLENALAKGGGNSKISEVKFKPIL